MASAETAGTKLNRGDPDLVLGLDPGSAIMGYGLVRAGGNDLEMVEYGTFRTSPDLTLPQRLLKIYQELTALLQRCQPGQIAVEELFFNKNTTTAIAVGQARGVAMLAAAQKQLELFEYTPLQVKQALVGYGRATKDQIQQMVKITLNLEAIPQPDDAADALAIAICHIRSRVLQERLQNYS